MPDGIDDSPAKPAPFWGTSFWWTRVGYLLGLVSVVVGALLLQRVDQHVGPCGLPNQLSNPLLAIELPRSWSDIVQIIGPCDAAECLESKGETVTPPGWRPPNNRAVICPDKIRALVDAQQIDYVLIVCYWLFFLYLAVINWRFCYWPRFPVFSGFLGKLGAVVCAAAASYASLNDWRENAHIVDSLHQVHSAFGATPAIRDFAYVKWRLIFIAIGAAAPVFAFWTGGTNPTEERASAVSFGMAWLTAALALSTAWTGILSTVFGDDQRMEVAAGRLGTVLMMSTLTLATAQIWRGGTILALDRLAALPGLRLIARLFGEENTTVQNGGMDPDRPL